MDLRKNPSSSVRLTGDGCGAHFHVRGGAIEGA